MKIVCFKKNIVKIAAPLAVISCFIFPRLVFAATLLKPPTNLGLVAYWSFNEGTSTIAHDYSGKGNNGVLTNFSFPATSISGWANGKRGYSLNFDSSDDMVRVASSSSLSNLGASTYSVWIYPRSEGRGNRGGIFNKVSTAGSSNGGQEFEFGNVGMDGVDRTNALAFFVPYSGTSLMRITSDNTVTMGKWQHVVLTWDGSTSASNVHIYIDGVEASYQKSQDAVGTRTDDTNHGLSIGVGQYVLTNNSFDGLMDEFRIYNRVLASSEIATLYRAGNLTNKLVSNRGMIAYWPLNEGTSTSVGDFSGNGINGVMSNFANPATSISGWVSGKFGRALSFDNTDDKVTVQQNAKINNLSSFTVSAWIKPNSAGGGGNGRILNKTDVAGTLGWHFRVNSNNSIQFNRQFTTLMSTVSSADSIILGKWQHVVVTHDGSNTAANTHMYINGAEVSYATQTNGSGSASDDSSVNLIIGDLGNSTREFDGSIDDIRMFNRAISLDEVRGLYQNSKQSISNSGQNNRMVNGLVGLWSFNGSDIDWSKNIVYDRSGSNNNGTTTGMSTTTSPVAGKVGQALYFNGNNNLISVPDSPSVSVTGPITISFWFKTSTTAGGSRLFWKRSGANNNSYDVLVSGAGALTLNIDTGGSVGATTPGSYMDNQWHHFAGTWDQSNIIVYIDGVSVASTPQTGSMSDTVNPLTIGNKNDGSAPYTGLLDEVRLYNRALSSVEVKQLYHMGK